ncbi:MAG TPA: ribbon-helix-helix protein, CopG family [Verrucomicrobiae bacterium]|nr:ribbon-helix-helix protein, CopG family [Verrucomicrobiae bacterium]
MPKPLSLRLDDKTRRRISRLARGKRLSTSDAIRDAIERWIEQEAPAGSPYQAVADLLGVARGRNRNRSSRTGRAFAKLLKRRRKRK